jgi:rod shape-determining protein MreD
MHPAILFILLMGLTIIESTVFSIPPLNFFHPQLTIVTVMLIALFRGPSMALILGVLIGLVRDIVYGTFIGMEMFTMGLVGYFSGSTFRLFLRRHLVLVVMTVIAFTAVYNVVTYGISVLFAQKKADISVVLVESIRMMIMNGIITLFLYVPASKYLPLRTGRTFVEEEL